MGACGSKLDKVNVAPSDMITIGGNTEKEAGYAQLDNEG